MLNGTQAHTATQPGLMGHSWNPDTDLLKQYLLSVEVEPGKGWLALSSHDTTSEAIEALMVQRDRSEHRAIRIRDQFTDSGYAVTFTNN